MPSHVRHFFEKLTGRPRHLADVANDTLSNSNLLHRIVSFIDDEQKRRATLHSLALSNKSLSEAALAELWSDLDGLEMFKGVYDVAERAFYEEHIFQMRSLTIVRPYSMFLGPVFAHFVYSFRPLSYAGDQSSNATPTS